MNNEESANHIVSHFSQIHQIDYQKRPKVYYIILHSVNIKANESGSYQKYDLLYFYLVIRVNLHIFVEKFIMSYHGTDGYNETAARNSRSYPTGPC